VPHLTEKQSVLLIITAVVRSCHEQEAKNVRNNTISVCCGKPILLFLT